MNRKTFEHILISAMVLVAASATGFRDITVGADSQSYANYYQERLSCKCFGYHEPIFDILTIAFSYTGLSYSFYFLFISLLIFSTAIFAARLAFKTTFSEEIAKPGKRQEATFIFIFFLLILINPLFQQAHINAIRQGLAACIIVASIFQFYQKKTGQAWLLLIISSLIHYSSLLYAPLIILYFYGGRGVKTILLATFGLSSLMYATGYSEGMIRAISPKLWSYVSEYGLYAADSYKAGVRLDFLLATLLSLSVVFFAAQLVGDQRVRRRLLDMTLFGAVLSIPFNLLGWGVFSNRYLYTTWIIFSFLLTIACYALIRRKNVKAGHICLFMPLAIYAFLSQTT